MSAFTVTFETDNAAFEDYETEVARILRAVAKQVESGSFGGVIHDVNGNRVGNWMQEAN
jgi:hypothetical protein